MGSKGALCHPHAQMAKMPAEDGMQPLIGVEMTSAVCKGS